MSLNIVIVDYKLGNIRSVISAFEKFGVNATLSSDKNKILNSDGLVLPGVGAFPQAMQNLESYFLKEVICNYANLNKPLLGICLGMQLLFSQSEEFEITKGLGLIDGEVIKIPIKNPSLGKLPQVGFNSITRNLMNWKGTILEGIENSSDLYFVHGFAAKPKDQKEILSTTTYAEFNFCSTVKKGNIYGCQFHPEKSAEQGLKVIENFIKIVTLLKINSNQ